MKRIVLFSTPTADNIEKLSEVIFPDQIPDKILAYMPSNGHETKQEYTDYWRGVAEKRSTKFTFVDNMLSEEKKEADKIKAANILLISGGNTFELLNNLRQSKLDQAVIAFANKDEFVLGGFSAGAIVLSPTIGIANIPSGTDPTDTIDHNKVGITDLTGLNIIDFEIQPHYVESLDKKILDEYRTQTQNEVRGITNEDMIVLDL